MSWTFSAIGKPRAVARKAKVDLSNIKCAEPEETIKWKAGDIIKECLSPLPEDSVVQVEVSGSQYTNTGKPGAFFNSLSISIKPISGFVEE